MEEIKQVNLEQYIESHGYTKEEWDKAVGELCERGVSKGCYEDYNLLSLVINWLCNYKSIIKK